MNGYTEARKKEARERLAEAVKGRASWGSVTVLARDIAAVLELPVEKRGSVWYVRE